MKKVSGQLQDVGQAVGGHLELVEKLKSLVGSVPAAVAVINSSTNKVYCVNQLMEQLCGYRNEEYASGKVTLAKLFDGAGSVRLKTQLQNSTADPATRTKYVIYRIAAKSGRQQSAFVYLNPIEMQGADAGTFFMLMALPDHSNIEPPFWSVETREVFLQQINYESFGTFEWYYETGECLWSPGIYRMFETENRTHGVEQGFFTNHIVEPDKDRFDAAARAALANGVIDIEVGVEVGQGRLRHVHFLGKRFKNGVPKLVGSIRDITPQRTIELNMNKMVEELNNSNKELEEFAYVASHDLQEPLRKITTFSGWLAGKYNHVLQQDGVKYLERIIAASENMRVLINDLLEFSRISKTIQPFSSVNLRAVLRMVKTDLELVIEETQTNIVAADLPTIEGINLQMKQLFFNIINNAIKFRRNGIPPIIRISAREMERGEKLERGLPEHVPHYKIRICDNGIGFEEKYAPKIFQVFLRLHGKSEFPGSGIGLAICKKIVEYHHGLIYADGVPGQGACFTIILPASQPGSKKRDA
jgi:signal transduction histidine kinase